MKIQYANLNGDEAKLFIYIHNYLKLFINKLTVQNQ